MKKSLCMLLVALVAGFYAHATDYQLVKSLDQVEVGEEYILYSPDGNAAMGGFYSSTNKYMTAVSGVVAINDVISVADDSGIEPFTLCEGVMNYGDNPTYAMKLADGSFIGCTSSSNTGSLTKSATNVQNCAVAFTEIGYTDHFVAIVFANNDNGGLNRLKYNKSNPRFTNYPNNTQSGVQLFKRMAPDNRKDAGLAWSASAVSFNMGVSTSADLPTLANPYGLAVEFSSSNLDVATIDESGVVSVEGVGKAVITASFEGDDDYRASKVSYTITVLDPNNAFDIIYASNFADLGTSYKDVSYTSANGITYVANAIKGGNDFQFNSTGRSCGIMNMTNEQGLVLKSVTVTYSNEKAANMDVYGSNEPFSSLANVKQGTKLGTITAVVDKSVTLSSEDNYKYVAVVPSASGSNKVASFTFIWGVEQPRVATPIFVGVSDRIGTGSEVSLLCATEGATIYYTLSDADPTTSSQVYTEPFVFDEVGEYTISAFAVKEGMLDSYVSRAQFEVYDSRSETGLRWSDSSYTYMMGTSTLADLPTLVNPNNLAVTYSSSDVDVATIDANGAVTIEGLGTTTISAAFAGNSAYAPEVVKYTLTVVDPYNADHILKVTDFNASGSSYQDLTYTTEDGITYIANCMKSGSDFQFNSSNTRACGVAVSANETGLIVKSVTINYAAEKAADFSVYGHTSPVASLSSAASGKLIGTFTGVDGGSFTLNINDSYEYIALVPSKNGSNKVASFSFVWGVEQPRVATPAFDVTNGRIEMGSAVAISCSTADAAIYYTLNGAEPTSASTLYTEPIEFPEAGKYTLKAIAVKEGMLDSHVAALALEVYDPAQGGGDEGIVCTVNFVDQPQEKYLKANDYQMDWVAANGTVFSTKAARGSGATGSTYPAISGGKLTLYYSSRSEITVTGSSGYFISKVKAYSADAQVVTFDYDTDVTPVAGVAEYSCPAEATSFTFSGNAGTTNTTYTALDIILTKDNTPEYKVYFDNKDMNWEEPYCYYWGEGSDQNNRWPGQAMTQVSDDIWMFQFDSEFEPLFVIFNDGSGNNGAENQTENLAFENGNTYTYALAGSEYPRFLYMLGNVNGSAWSTTNAGATAQGDENHVYTFSEVTIDNPGSGLGYFSFASVLSERNNDWDTVNQGTRYGATSSDLEIFGGNSYDIQFFTGTFAGSCYSWAIASDVYDFIVDLPNRTLTVSPVSGIETIDIDAASAEYYNLQGVRVERPASGLYIVRQAGKVAKVLIK